MAQKYNYKSGLIGAAEVASLSTDVVMQLKAASDHQISLSPVGATSGTVAVTVKYLNSDDFEVLYVDNAAVVIDLADPATVVGISGYIDTFKFTPTAVNGTYQIAMIGSAGEDASATSANTGSIANLDDAVYGLSAVDMSGANYTLTLAQCKSAVLVIVDAASSTITIPTAYLSFLPRQQVIVTLLTTAVTVQYEGVPSSALTIPSGYSTCIVHAPEEDVILSEAEQDGAFARQESTERIKLTSQGLRATAVAGEIEYLNATMYGSPSASGRGVLVTEFNSINAAAVSLADDTSEQSYLTAAADTLTLAANTTYRFETDIYLATGTSSHFVNFLIDGTAVIDSIAYNSASRGGSTIGSADATFSTSAAATKICLAGTPSTRMIRIVGHFRVSTAGTIIPKISFNTAPGGTNEASINTSFRCFPIGANTVVSNGNWA